MGIGWVSYPASETVIYGSFLLLVLGGIDSMGRFGGNSHYFG